MKTAEEIFQGDPDEVIHHLWPRPLGFGRSEELRNHPLCYEFMFRHPAHTAALFSVTGRLERGVIPFPLCDQRCSYCMKCGVSLRCARCSKVFYCDKRCQKKHWKFHRQVCGTVTESWNTDDDRVRRLNFEEEE